MFFFGVNIFFSRLAVQWKFFRDKQNICSAHVRDRIFFPKKPYPFQVKWMFPKAKAKVNYNTVLNHCIYRKQSTNSACGHVRRPLGFKNNYWKMQILPHIEMMKNCHTYYICSQN